MKINRSMKKRMAHNRNTNISGKLIFDKLQRQFNEQEAVF